MKNILITGGAGFIGSNLALKLQSLGYYVTVLDNLSPQIHGLNPAQTSPLYRSILNENIKIIVGSVTVKTDWLKALNGQDAIIHFAAETGTGQSMYEIHKYVDTNIGGTALLLDILTNENHSIKKAVVASSRAIYGEGKYNCNDHGIVFPDSRKEKDMIKSDFVCKCPVCNNIINVVSTGQPLEIKCPYCGAEGTVKI